jgi:hypothetical protein
MYYLKKLKKNIKKKTRSGNVGLGKLDSAE